mgnify:CR=1 FL=1
MPVSFRRLSPLAAMAMASLCIAPAQAADAASDVALVANPDEPATIELEEMFALASDCTVALSVLQENGATILCQRNVSAVERDTDKGFQWIVCDNGDRYRADAILLWQATRRR